VIHTLKAFAKRHWPTLRLRTILFSVLLFTAAMPGISAIFLRVYENTLVRQTEAELVAQGAALAAAAAVAWPGDVEAPPDLQSPGYYRPETTTIDLSRSALLPERPAAKPATRPADPAAVAVAARLDPVIARTSQTTLASVLLLDSTGAVVRGPGVSASLAVLGVLAVLVWISLERRTALAAAPVG